MSGLAAILAGHHPVGVHRWHAHFAVADVRHAVEHAHWRFAYVDGALAQTKAEVLAALGESLAFPGHFGRNLDALNDCLRDVEEKTLLLWDDWAIVARQEPEGFEGLLAVLRGRAGDSPEFGVLLRGEGPDIDGVTSID